MSLPVYMLKLGIRHMAKLSYRGRGPHIVYIICIYIPIMPTISPFKPVFLSQLWFEDLFPLESILRWP